MELFDLGKKIYLFPSRVKLSLPHIVILIVIGHMQGETVVTVVTIVTVVTVMTVRTVVTVVTFL